MIIECKKVKFYASHDEDAFFEWLAKIKSITNVKGKRDSIFLTIEGLTDEDLYSLIALFRRYKIKMDSLEIMLDDSQKNLFNRSQKGYCINMYPSN